MQELKLLAGLLNFVCKVVALDLAFLLQICDAMEGLQSQNHWIQISKENKIDLAMWLEFIASYNGVSFWQMELQVELCLD